MKKDSNVIPLRQPEEVDDPLTAVLRSGARRLLAQAVEAEAEAFLASMRELRLPDGRERVVRHGHGPERLVQTGIGPVPVRRVKVRDRGAASASERIRFTSALLPRWARRTRSLDALLPILYLRGVSMGDFQDALAALLGPAAPNLSPSVIGRLRDAWQADYERWQRRDLSARQYVYLWADGVFLQARMEPQAECMLVLIGATPEGRKELVGFQVGVRESAQSWRELLVDVKARGLAIAPQLATGDGGLGFWKALEEVFPATPHQRCWVHKAANVLDKLPKSVQPRGAAGPARDLAGARPRHRRGGDGDVCREVCGEIRQGGRLPAQGSGGAADLLRLSRRALGPPAHIEPDRERVRHRPAAHGADQGRAVTGYRPPHGVQAGDDRGEDLASAEGREPVAQGRAWCQVPQRRRGHRRPRQDRRLIRPLSPISRHSSRQPVLDQVFGPFVRQGVHRLQQQDFEHQHVVEGRPAALRAV